MSLVTVKTFDNAFEAHLLRSILENKGVLCVLQDEHTALYGFEANRIKVQVNEIDKVQALQLVSEFNNSKTKNDKGELLKCPECDSHNVISVYHNMKSIKGLLFIFTSGILSIIPFVSGFSLFPIKGYKCYHCSYEFK